MSQNCEVIELELRGNNWSRIDPHAGPIISSLGVRTVGDITWLLRFISAIPQR
jgi:hypothetical protein